MPVETEWCSPGLAGRPLERAGGHWVVVDTETTGMRPGPDHITEFAAVILDGQGAFVDSWSWVRSDGEERLRAFGEDLEPFLQDGVLVAHNAQFDRAFLAATGALAGLTLAAPPRWLCTMLLTGRRVSLEALAQLFSVRCQARHTAKGDAATLSVVTARLLDGARSSGAATVDGLVAECQARRGELGARREVDRAGWALVRATLDLVVPMRFPDVRDRAAVQAVWTAQSEPLLGPGTIAGADSAAATLREAGVSALAFTVCITELTDAYSRRAGTPVDT